jgi:hypothetical protein
MASEPITNEDQRRQVLEGIAPRIGRVFCRLSHVFRFERDELVNEAWLRKSVRAATQAHHVAKAGRNAMYDYCRNQIGRYKPKPVPQNLTDDVLLEDELPDLWMDFDCMTSRLNQTQKLVLKLRADWFDDTEVAKIIGVKHSYVGHIMKPLRKDQKLRKCLL